jgi:hypothetical protein
MTASGFVFLLRVVDILGAIVDENLCVRQASVCVWHACVCKRLCV